MGPYLHIYVVKVILPAQTRLYSLTLNKLSYKCVEVFTLHRPPSFILKGGEGDYVLVVKFSGGDYVLVVKLYLSIKIPIYLSIYNTTNESTQVSLFDTAHSSAANE